MIEHQLELIDKRFKVYNRDKEKNSNTLSERCVIVCLHVFQSLCVLSWVWSFLGKVTRGGGKMYNSEGGKGTVQRVKWSRSKEFLVGKIDAAP